MSTKTETPQESPRSPFWRTLWRKRAAFQIGKARHHRQVQYKQQMQTLVLVLAGVILLGVVVILSNWREAGGTKRVNCLNYPDYCVPFAGGATGTDPISQVESPKARDLHGENHGVKGVTRGFTADNVPFIGDPNAPVHFRVVADFACSHCNDYHQNDLNRFVKDYVLTGKATLESVMTTGVGGPSSETATEAALCAGEQGAFWEMSDELFRLARSQGVTQGFTILTIQKSADDMGLDSGKLTSCIASKRYAGFIEAFKNFSLNEGVGGTPTLLVSYGNSGEWQKLDNNQRDYNNMKAMTEGANSQK